MAKIFFSYSHADEKLRDELEKHLSILKRKGVIETWHDRRITAGEVLDHAISQNLDSADVILLLVSPDFLNSDYCYEKEMQRAMARHAAGEARVIPVILRPCDWHDTPLGSLLATPTDGKPVIKFPTLDDAFLEVERAIKQALKEMVPGDQVGAPPASPDTPTKVVVPEKLRTSNLRIKKDFSDRDKDRFLEDSYEFIANFFEGSLLELAKRNPTVETDFKRIDAHHFMATLYLNGKQKSCCKIWFGGGRSMVGGIAYTDMNSSITRLSDDNSYNENLHVVSDGYELFLQPLGMMHFPAPSEKKQLTPEGAAEFLWAYFIQPLQQ